VLEILRTVFLMGFATRIYRDEQGNQYYVEIDRWTERRPNKLWRIPDSSAFESLMKETYKAKVHASLFVLTFVGVIAVARLSFDIDPLWIIPALVPLVALVVFGGRGQVAALKRCEPVSLRESALILSRDVSLARLRFVVLVRALATVVVILGVIALPVIGYVVGAAAPAALDGVVIMLTAVAWTGSFHLIIAGGHVLHSDRLDLGDLKRA
jgi:hypothetical protein